MRNLTEIASILQQAKINFSYRVQVLESERTRGLSTMEYNERMKVMFGASCMIWALDENILSVSQQSQICDYLTRNGFYNAADQLLFTEEIYTDDFDTV